MKKPVIVSLVCFAGLVSACQSPADTPTVAVNAEALVSSGSPDGFLVARLHEPVGVHCIQSELNAITDRAERALEAFECGDELFEFQYNAVDGSGAQVGQGKRFTRVPRADLDGIGEWANHFPQRATGPNAQACNECHARPATGSGPISVNAIRDPLHTGEVGSFIQRNTPHLMMSGALQLLAEEMTTELQRQKYEGIERACEQERRVTVSLESKGVSFGRIRVSCDGEVRTRRLEGIDEDLVVRPFQWKGNTVSLRDFNRGASHNEIGMQPVEITGDNIDGDGDGVANEFGIGDMTAMAVYVAGQARPVTKLELDDLGLIELLGEDSGPLTADERAEIKHGRNVFEDVGCASCHIPKMQLKNAVFSEPSQHPAYRDEVFPAGQDPVARGVDVDNPVLFDLTKDQPDNVFVIDGVEHRIGNLNTDGYGNAIVELFGDLKRHSMGENLAEAIDEAGTGADVWMTKELWGLGSSAPYMHDGRATTVTEAILEHGGEGEASRDQFVAQSLENQAALVAFLENLVLLKEE